MYRHKTTNPYLACNFFQFVHRIAVYFWRYIQLTNRFNNHLPEYDTNTTLKYPRRCPLKPSCHIYNI